MKPYDNRDPFGSRFRAGCREMLEVAGLLLLGLILLVVALVVGVAIVAAVLFGTYAFIGAIFGAMGGGAVWAFRFITGG